MKRSAKIELVLITALLAGCNREIVLPASQTAFPEDSTLTATPLTYDGICAPCSLADSTVVWNYSFGDLWPYNRLLIGHFTLVPYYTVTNYRKGAVWKKEQFIVRGGFGKTWVSSAAS